MINDNYFKNVLLSLSEDEEIAFVGWINYQLKEDPEVKTYLPLSKVGGAIFDALKDGIILWWMILYNYTHNNFAV